MADEEAVEVEPEDATQGDVEEVAVVARRMATAAAASVKPGVAWTGTCYLAAAALAGAIIELSGGLAEGKEEATAALVRRIQAKIVEWSRIQGDQTDFEAALRAATQQVGSA